MVKTARTTLLTLVAAATILLVSGLALASLARGSADPSSLNTSQPEGSAITALAIHPRLPAQRLISTTTGLSRTQDGGATWQRSSLPESWQTPADYLVYDHGQPDTVYALGAFGLGISDDAGRTWAVAAPPPDTMAYRGIAASPADHALYVIAHNGLLRSDDQGYSWAALPFPSTYGELQSMAPHPKLGNVLFAVTSLGLLRSDDRGAGWTPVAGALAQDARAQDALEYVALAQAPDGQLLAHTANGSYSSEDDGLSWVPQPGSARAIAPTRSLPGAASALSLWDRQGAESSLLPLIPTDQPLVTVTVPEPRHTQGLAATRDMLFETKDGGTSWMLWDTALADSAAPRDLFAGAWAGTMALVLMAAGTLSGAGALAVWWRGRTGTIRTGAHIGNSSVEGKRAAGASAVETSQGPTAPRPTGDSPRPSPAVTERESPPAGSPEAETLPTSAVMPVPDSDHLTGESTSLGTQDPSPDAGSVAHLVETLCEQAGFHILREHSNGPFTGYMVDASGLRLKLPSSFPMIACSENFNGHDRHAEISALAAALGAISPFALIIVPDASAGTARHQDQIVLGQKEAEQILQSEDPQAALSRHIQVQADLSAISPYVQSGPVPAAMFFGREYELKAILRTLYDRSFAIVGGRKMGKTSMLCRLDRELAQTTEFIPVYLDCHHVVDHASFLRALSIMGGVPVESASLDVLRRVAMRLKSREGSASGRVVLELDEIDNLLRYDMAHGTRLFQVFRALSEEGLCRFIYCGERVLDGFLKDPASPLYTSCGSLRLGYLGEQEADWMVRQPMGELGISFQDNDRVPAGIVALSGRHPNILQAICQLLVERLSGRQERVILAEDLEAIEHSEAFHDLFFEANWGNATTLERLVSVLMAQKERFGIEQVVQALEAIGIRVPEDELRRAMDGLVLSSLIKPHGTGYAFASGAFARVLKETGFAQGFRETLTEKFVEEHL